MQAELRITGIPVAIAFPNRFRFRAWTTGGRPEAPPRREPDPAPDPISAAGTVFAKAASTRTKPSPAHPGSL